MANLTYKILQKKQKMHIKAYAILCGILFVTVAIFSYLKWEEYSKLKVLVSGSEDLISILQTNATSSTSMYLEKKGEFDALHKEIEDKLEYIFPPVDNYTALTRQLDSFEEDLSKANNPFEVSHIDFQAPVKEEEYSILPFRMSIQSSNDNFEKFLHLMENSGSLDDRIRLMDITSIRLNFQGNEEDVGSPEMINFTVQINAYFQNQT